MRRMLAFLTAAITAVASPPVTEIAQAQQPTCAACGQTILSTYVQWGKKLYHPQHFVCALCNRPIGTGAFVPYEGKPYHQQCYLEAFAERCAICGKPLVGRIISKDGQSYHEQCYQNTVAEKCAVCGQGLIGAIVIDPWGNRYHAAHQRQMPSCDYCNRIISPRTSNGGYTYADGRNICGFCYRSQISGDRAAQPLIAEVRSKLDAWGVVVPADAAPVLLVDRTTLRNLLRRTGQQAGPNVNGFTSVLTEKQGNQIVKREMAVYVLFGMPRELFEGTVAHELTHVWFNLHNGRRLAPAFEEGACNYMKFRWHEQSDAELASYAMKAMQQDQDPNYGAGFRRARALVDKQGFSTLLTLMGRSVDFPWGY